MTQWVVEWVSRKDMVQLLELLQARQTLCGIVMGSCSVFYLTTLPTAKIMQRR